MGVTARERARESKGERERKKKKRGRGRARARETCSDALELRALALLHDNRFLDLGSFRMEDLHGLLPIPAHRTGLMSPGIWRQS